VDIALEPGTVQPAVELQASAPVVNSENATSENILEAKRHHDDSAQRPHAGTG
jgi:hypothetical protein